MSKLEVGQVRKWKANMGYTPKKFTVRYVGKSQTMYEYEDDVESNYSNTAILRDSEEVKPEPKLTKLFAYSSETNVYIDKDNNPSFNYSYWTKRELIVKDGCLYVKEEA